MFPTSRCFICHLPLFGWKLKGRASQVYASGVGYSLIVPWRCEWDLKLVIRKLTWRVYNLNIFLWNFQQANATQPHWWQISICSVNDLVSSGKEMFNRANIRPDLCCHMATLGHNELTPKGTNSPYKFVQRSVRAMYFMHYLAIQSGTLLHFLKNKTWNRYRMEYLWRRKLATFQVWDKNRCCDFVQFSSMNKPVLLLHTLGYIAIIPRRFIYYGWRKH